METIRKANEAKERRAAKRKEQLERVVPLIVPAPAPAPAPAQQMIRKNDAGYTAEEAKRWCPEGYSLEKGEQGRERWRARFPDDDQSRHSKEYKVVPTPRKHTDWTAMVFCLRLCWADFTKKGGSACPYEFEDAEVLLEAPPVQGDVQMQE